MEKPASLECTLKWLIISSGFGKTPAGLQSPSTISEVEPAGPFLLIMRIMEMKLR